MLNKVKEAYYQKWRPSQNRYANKDKMPVGWTTPAYSVFVYCGPRGKDLSILKTGSLDEDCDEDTSRHGAREEEKKAKKEKLQKAPHASHDEHAKAST